MENLYKRIKNLSFVILLGIIILASFLRVYQLSTNPPSLTWDEAAWGYNAYSLGIDGRDEFGNFLPYKYLESFGDFKPPMYAYLTVIPVKILGLNEFATRLPSAVFGIFTVFITYFLVKRLFPDSKNKEAYALISAFILAISPWHILLSRAAFEANVATFFLAFGIFSFLAGVQEKPKFLVISAISFALSFYTFNTSRVFAPLIVIVLVFAFRKILLKRKVESLVAAAVGFVLVFPIIPFLLSPQASLRFHEVNIFTDPGIVNTSNQKIANDENAWWSTALNNRRVYYGLSFVQHYFDNLDPMFLFIKGDGNPKFSTQMVGQMYIWEIVFFIGGILFLFRKKEGHWWIVPIWIILGIIPAATARETPHALRIETTLPAFQILSAYGIVQLAGIVSTVRLKFTKIKISYILGTGFGLIALFNFAYFYHDYFSNYPRIYSGEWQYGYRESIAFVEQNSGDYDEVYITNSLGRPYIYYLFYLKYPPDKFRDNAIVERDAFGFVEVRAFDKYNFKSNDEEDKEGMPSALYIMGNPDTPDNANVLREFKLLNGNNILNAFTL